MTMYTCHCHEDATRDVVVGYLAHTWDCTYRNYNRLSEEFIAACVKKYHLDPGLPLGFSQAVEDADLPAPVREVEAAMASAEDGESDDAASTLLAAYAIVLVLPFIAE